MAELVDSNKKNKIVLRLDNYENKDEYWFSSHIFITYDNLTPKVESPFHLNDLVGLMDNLKLLIKREINFYAFEPIEPYLKMIFNLINDQYVISISFSEGPIFSADSYRNFTINTNGETINAFIKQIRKELENIDPNLELKKVNF